MPDVTSGFQVRDAAPEAYEEHVAVFMRPLVRALLERVQLKPGGSLLDVACGTGFVARAAAGVVGATGRLAGVDVNAGMLAVAHDRTPRRAPAIEWTEASALELPFEDDSYDAVVSQQGIQFVPDIPRAVAEMARVARPGHTVAVTAWTRIEETPYLHAQRVALSETLGEEAVSSLDATFAVPGDTIRDAFVAAGLQDVTMERLAPKVHLPPVTTYLPKQIAATPWGVPFAAADKDARKRMVRRVADLLIEDTLDGGPLVPFSSWLISGTA